MVNTKKIEKAVKLLLEGMGEDPSREGLIDTPRRVSGMYNEVLAGMEQNAEEHLARQFNVEGSDIVIEKDITFYSLCEHHLMPFFGKVHIAYIPEGKVVGLSKLARTVEVFARRLQLQEQLTRQIADAIEENLSPKGVMVVVEAEHTCMTMRGVKKPGSQTVTTVTRGEFKKNAELQTIVLDSIRR